MKTITILKYLFLIFGLGLMALAFGLYRNAEDLLANAAFAEGSIVDIHRSVSSGSTYYHAVVSL